MAVKSWWIAARPKTLTAAVIPVLVGTSLARAEGYALRVDLFLCALIGAVSIQVGTNLVNDALDFKRGADTAERLGPVRVTQSGLLSADRVLRGAYLCFAVALLVGVPLVLSAGWPLLAVGLASIVAAYAYTGGPYPLAYLGVAELFVIFFFGVVAVSGTHYLYSHVVDLAAIYAGLAVGALATVLLAVNNLRDIEGDRKIGKRTLAVRFGEGFARREVLFCAFAPFLLNFYWSKHGHPWAAILPWFSLPLAIQIERIMGRRGRGAELNAALGIAAGLHALFGLGLAVGLYFG